MSMVQYQDASSDRSDKREIAPLSAPPSLPKAQSPGSYNQDLSQLKTPNVSLGSIESLSVQKERQSPPWGGPRLVENIVQSWANHEYGRAVVGSLSGGLPIAGAYLGKAVSDFGLLCASLGIEAFRSTPIPLLGNPEHTANASLFLWSIGSILVVAGSASYLAGKSVQIPCDVCAAAIDRLLAPAVQ